MSPTSIENEIIQILRQAIETQQAITFIYSDSFRVVEPYVLGLSSEGNPLLRGFQTEGVSLSGKGAGWRVFQIRKMFDVDPYEEWFEPDFSEYDPSIPWIWEVDTQIT